MCPLLWQAVAAGWKEDDAALRSTPEEEATALLGSHARPPPFLSQPTLQMATSVNGENVLLVPLLQHPPPIAVRPPGLDVLTSLPVPTHADGGVAPGSAHSLAHDTGGGLDALRAGHADPLAHLAEPGEPGSLPPAEHLGPIISLQQAQSEAASLAHAASAGQ